VSARGAGTPVEVTVTAEDPSGLQDALGVDRSVWLGEVAATRVDPLREPPAETALGDACGDYVDHLRRPGRGGRPRDRR
jgi:hypothetical protein